MDGIFLYMLLHGIYLHLRGVSRCSRFSRRRRGAGVGILIQIKVFYFLHVLYRVRTEKEQSLQVKIDLIEPFPFHPGLSSNFEFYRFQYTSWYQSCWPPALVAHILLFKPVQQCYDWQIFYRVVLHMLLHQRPSSTGSLGRRGWFLRQHIRTVTNVVRNG